MTWIATLFLSSLLAALTKEFVYNCTAVPLLLHIASATAEVCLSYRGKTFSVPYWCRSVVMRHQPSYHNCSHNASMWPPRLYCSVWNTYSRSVPSHGCVWNSSQDLFS